MAVLKDLIVHGQSRFLNTSYFNQLKTDKIGAEEGIFNKIVATTGDIGSLTVEDLTAGKATVLSLLDVRGELHTNQWTNSNIATIDGSFYITPTIGVPSGTMTTTANSVVVNGSNFPISSLYVNGVNSDNTAATIAWTSGSKVLVTGEILVNGTYMPLGTLVGILDSDATATQIKIKSITDNRYQTAESLAEIGTQSTALPCRNVKVSLYQTSRSSTLYPLGIFMTALGENGRTFLDIYGGGYATSTAVAGGFAKPVLRIGNLAGLPAVGGSTPTGYGIYTSNGYFSGTIVAKQGKIGDGTAAWTIGNDSNNRAYIYSGISNITTSGSTAGTYVGTNGISNYASATQYVNLTGGKITAQGADIAGKITASSGSIGGWNIGTDTNKSLYYGNQTPGATTTNLVLSPTSATNSNAIGGSGTGLTWFISAGKVFGVTTAGALYSTSGYIANWKIESNDLVTGTWGADNSAMLCTGTSTSKSIGGSGSINGWVFTAGANFGVTKSGALYANSAHITGEITANSGKIGKWNIETSTGTPTYGGAIYTGTFGSDEGIYITPKYYSNTDIAGSYSSVAQQDTSPTAGYYNWCIAVSNKFGVTNTGKVFASEGMIAGFAMASKTLMTNNSSGGMIYISSNSNRDAFSANYEYPSNITPSSDRGYFRVTQNGIMYAQGADITGDIKAQSFIAYDYYNSTYRTRAIVNTDGLTVYDGSGTADANKVAIFGSTVQVGKKAVGYTTIASKGMDIYAGSSNALLAHIGYDDGTPEGGGTPVKAPYYSFGSRASGSDIGGGSFSTGMNNTASGYLSHTEGKGTQATGDCAHAEGYYTVAAGHYSHASGKETVADQDAQTAVGKYNTKNNTNNLFVVGIGTSDSARKNGFGVASTGKVTIDDKPLIKVVTNISLNSTQLQADGYTASNLSKDVSSSIPSGYTMVAVIPRTTGGNSVVMYYCEASGTTVYYRLRNYGATVTVTPAVQLICVKSEIL